MTNDRAVASSRKRPQGPTPAQIEAEHAKLIRQLKDALAVKVAQLHDPNSLRALAARADELISKESGIPTQSASVAIAELLGETGVWQTFAGIADALPGYTEDALKQALQRLKLSSIIEINDDMPRRRYRYKSK
jgi:hypothetical protein